MGMFNVLANWPNKKYLAKKFGEHIDFSHKHTIYKLKFGRLKFGKTRTTRQIRQTFPLPNISAIRYAILLQVSINFISMMNYLPACILCVIINGTCMRLCLYINSHFIQLVQWGSEQ